MSTIDQILDDINQERTRLREVRDAKKAELQALEDQLRRFDRAAQVFNGQPAERKAQVAKPKAKERQQEPRFGEETYEKTVAYIQANVEEPFTSGDLKGFGILSDNSISALLLSMRARQIVRAVGKVPAKHNSIAYRLINEEGS